MRKYAKYKLPHKLIYIHNNSLKDHYSKMINNQKK